MKAIPPEVYAQMPMPPADYLGAMALHGMTARDARWAFLKALEQGWVTLDNKMWVADARAIERRGAA